MNRLRSLFNAEASFREGSFTTSSKKGKPVRSDPAMRNYRDLFEREFGGNRRVFNIVSETGLDLGVNTVSANEALVILSAAEKTNKVTCNEQTFAAGGQIKKFMENEIKMLKQLRAFLTNEIPIDNKQLEELLDLVDYLWAHFPDCAGNGGIRPPCSDLGFLKRIRTEIEPFLKCWEMALKEIHESNI